MEDRVYEPGFPTKTRTIRQAKVTPRPAGKRGPQRSGVLRNEPAVPLEPISPVEPQGRALERIKEAGRDPAPFKLWTKLCADAGVIAKEGLQYLIPTILTDKYIAGTRKVEDEDEKAPLPDEGGDKDSEPAGEDAEPEGETDG